MYGIASIDPILELQNQKVRAENGPIIQETEIPKVVVYQSQKASLS